MSANRYQILALDVDGTLLDPDGLLRPRTLAAVARAAKAGIRPVLCTGRRYRRARPIAQQLGLDFPLICNSGAIIKDPVSHQTLWRADFDESLTRDLIAFFHMHDRPAVVFTDRNPDEADFVVAHYPTGCDSFDDYVEQNRQHAEINSTWDARSIPQHGRDPKRESGSLLFHVCAIGELAQMLDLEQAAITQLRGRIQTFVQRSPRYQGTMCEILRHDAGKWAAIEHLAACWGVDKGAICAVGDDLNDVPMIQNAGLGVAMGHARPEVIAAADVITGCHDQDGVAMLVDQLLLA
jgi:Cof subfamily protein (haloacid dehalogenase superfamily)